MADDSQIYVGLGGVSVAKIFPELKAKKAQAEKSFGAAMSAALKSASSKGMTTTAPSHGMGYMLQGTIQDIQKTIKGKNVEVSCKAAVSVFSHPGKKLQGTFTETQTASTGSKPNEIEKATMSCVEATAKALMSKQVLPAVVKLGAPAAPSTTIYVEVGKMSVKTVPKDYQNKKDDLEKAMQAVAVSGVKKAASKGIVTKPPKDKKGYRISGTVEKIEETTKGNQVEISCEVKLLISVLPADSMLAFPSARAKITASTSPDDRAAAAIDCVTAVAEAALNQKALPAIIKFGPP